jgi:hypothetical protein
MSLAARQLSRLLLGPLKAYAQAAEKRPCLVNNPHRLLIQHVGITDVDNWLDTKA